MKLTKKQLIIIIISAAAILIAATTVALVLIFRDKVEERQVFYYEDFSYVIRDDGKLEIVSYAGTDSKITIPTSIDSRSVASIGEGAFRGNTAISTVKLGAMIRVIGDSAFESCASLQEITWGSFVTDIGKSAFRGCYSLESIELPSTVTSIGEGAFYSCGAATKLVLPAGIKTVPAYAFYGCSSLESAELSAVEHIGDYAFRSCEKLTAVSVDNVKTFGNFAFEKCTGLTSFSIGAGVESIGVGLLRSASNVKTVEVAAGNARYSTSTGALYDLTERCLMYLPPKSDQYVYTLPSDAKTVGNYACEECRYLTWLFSTLHLKALANTHLRIRLVLRVSLPIPHRLTTAIFPTLSPISAATRS